MSLLLLADTSSNRCSFALANNSKVLEERESLVSKGHSEIFFPLMEELLKDYQIGLNEITAFGVCTGPGNFTSLRVAISGFRGLSLSCKKPAIGVTAFETLALKRGVSLILVEGRGEYFYAQTFIDGEPNNKPMLVNQDSFSKENFSADCTVVGYKAEIISQKIGALTHIEVTKVNLLKFAQIVCDRIGQNHPRPSPLYIK
jgi:tRNA threonylcarbamoyl adenosine modification protein YeaZ